LIFNPASKPDFSVNGSTMEFGYEVTAGGGGFFTSVTGIDNDPITLTVTPKATSPSVPESSTWAMMLLGFAGLGFASYRLARRALCAITQICRVGASADVGSSTYCPFG
jgi:hypothetical protein